MKVAGVPLSLLSTMYWLQADLGARDVARARTIALPSWLARRMMFSYCRGSVNGACVTTGKVSSTGAGGRLLADLPGAEQRVLLADRVARCRWS